MILVVEGCGQWAMVYFEALQKLGARDVSAHFTYDSTFAFDLSWKNGAITARDLRLPTAEQAGASLEASLANARNIAAKSTFDLFDTKQTLGKSRRNNPHVLRQALPDAEAVFIVSPPHTHVEIAQHWLGRADRIFIEKPLGTTVAQVQALENEVAKQAVTKPTRVYGVDHYLVRCFQAAYDSLSFLDRIVPRVAGQMLEDIDWIEFYMTEPPVCTDGNYDASSMERRIGSVQDGMILDMGAHFLPTALPFVEPSSMKVTWAAAAVSEGLRRVLFRGGETFAVADIEGSTALVMDTKLKHRVLKRSHPFKGRVVIGKDVGKEHRKVLWLSGPRGALEFDLYGFRVYAHRDGKRWAVAALERDWAHFLLQTVMEAVRNDGPLPKDFPVLDLETACYVVQLLEDWKRLANPSPAPGQLTTYSPGEKVSTLTERLGEPREASKRSMETS